MVRAVVFFERLLKNIPRNKLDSFYSYLSRCLGKGIGSIRHLTPQQLFGSVVSGLKGGMQQMFVFCIKGLIYVKLFDFAADLLTDFGDLAEDSLTSQLRGELEQEKRNNGFSKVVFEDAVIEVESKPVAMSHSPELGSMVAAVEQWESLADVINEARRAAGSYRALRAIVAACQLSPAAFKAYERLYGGRIL